jgi:DNA-binding response OmpR family regulator
METLDMAIEPQRRNGMSTNGVHVPAALAGRPDEEANRSVVLLVDDDPTFRTLLRLTLPSDGFEVMEAADGAEALHLLDEQAPDVVVLDWNMPERSGGEVLAELRRRGSEVPVIVLTAERDAEPRAVARQLGADEFLTKPFSPLRLLDAIERLIADRSPN